MSSKLKFWQAWICLAAIVAGCAHAKDNLTKEQGQNRAIFAALDAIQTAYRNKDLHAFEGYLASEGSEVPAIRSAAEHDFGSFAAISLQIWPDRVTIAGSRAEVSCHWSGDWKAAGSERAIEREGNATLTFLDLDSPRLTEIVGDWPFGISPSKEPAGGGGL